MIPGIHNYSEIGKLNKVLLHRPGLELEALTPATMERLLFDDIPFLKVAQEEHDRFAEILKENGVEVIYYVEETAKALSTKELQQQLAEEFLTLSRLTSDGMRYNLLNYLMSLDPKEMVTKLIGGIKRMRSLRMRSAHLWISYMMIIRIFPIRCQTCTLRETRAHASAME